MEATRLEVLEHQLSQAAETLSSAVAKLEATKRDHAEAEKRLDALNSGDALNVSQSAYSAASGKVQHLGAVLSGATKAVEVARAKHAELTAEVAGEKASAGVSAIGLPGLQEAKCEALASLKKFASIIHAHNAERGETLRALKAAGAISGKVSPFASTYVTPKHGIGSRDRLTLNGSEVAAYSVEASLNELLTEVLGNSGKAA